MHPELEGLVKAYDAFIQARGPEARRSAAHYETKLEEVLTGHPNLTKAGLERLVRFAHNKWTLASQETADHSSKSLTGILLGVLIFLNLLRLCDHDHGASAGDGARAPALLTQARHLVVSVSCRPATNWIFPAANHFINSL